MNAVTLQKHMPLHLASSCGYDKLVTLLLRHGAAVDPEDGRKSTPLIEALKRSMDSTVKVLLEWGA